VDAGTDAVFNFNNGADDFTIEAWSIFVDAGFRPWYCGKAHTGRLAAGASTIMVTAGSALEAGIWEFTSPSKYDRDE